jgi:Ni,Fe-hydrogenase III small subunit
MRRSGKSIAALVLLTIVAVVVANIASAYVDQPPDHEGGPGCYCHNLGVGIWVNGSDTYAAREVIFVEAEPESSFVELISSQRIGETAGLLEPKMAWMPSMADNAKFTFDPQEVTDNAPQDQDPTVGNIAVLFKIAAPKEPGSYDISLSVQGPIVTFLVTVKSAAVSGFASVTYVKSPLAARTNSTIRIGVTLRNEGLDPHELYIYGIDRATGERILEKIYSGDPVQPNGTVSLEGAFRMPGGNLTLMIHSGHVEDSGDIDDGLSAVSILQLQSSPPTQTTQLIVLAREWAPWVAIIGASLGSVPLLEMYARRGKRFLSNGGRLKLAVVECAGCNICKNAIKKLEDGSFTFASREVDLASNLTTASDGGRVDAALVVGSIRTDKDIQVVREARQKAKVLVAFGACSSFGSMAAGERRRVDAEARGLRESTSKEALPNWKTDSKPLSDYVKVDLTIPGCPPPLEAIRYAIDALQHEASSGEKKQ